MGGLDAMRVFGVIVSVSVNLMPYIVLAIIPFRERLRFSYKNTIFIAAIMCFAQIILTLFLLSDTNNFGISPSAITVSFLCMYIAFFVLAVRASLTQMLFVLLVIKCYADFVSATGKSLELLIWADAVYDTPYRLTYGIAQLAPLAMTIPFVGKFFSQRVRGATSDPLNVRMWRFLWLIPATLYFVIQLTVFWDSEVYDILSNLRRVAMLAAINLGSFFIYYMLIRYIEESTANFTLKTENALLTMQAKQYENLQTRMEEVRQARHDLRHHVAALRVLANENDNDGIKKYLSTLGDGGDEPLVYCENTVANAVLSFYATQAIADGINVGINAQIPAHFQLVDTVLTIVLGNIMENAYEACKRQNEGERFIRFNAQVHGNVITIVAENSFSGVIHKSNGLFLSSKRDGEGIGTRSVDAAAKAHDGTAEFSYCDDVFRASVMLVGKVYTAAD